LTISRKVEYPGHSEGASTPTCSPLALRFSKIHEH
jgi:hypothetical protein